MGKIIKLKSTDLVQSKEQCNFPYAHVYIKKLLHTPTGLFVLGNHVRGKQSTKSFRDLRADLIVKITEAFNNHLHNDYLLSTIDCTNKPSEINNLIVDGWYVKIKQAEEAGEKE